MTLVFLLEERSMKELLDIILPKILPENVAFHTIPHEGKSDLEKSIKNKFKAWTDPEAAFVVVHDQDSGNCMEIKQHLSELCSDYRRRYLIRIPCHELEAWYWGDLEAVSAAYGKDLTALSRRSKFRDPDKIVNPKTELKKVLPHMTQIDGAKRIAEHMCIEKNTSHSFQVFIRGVQSLCHD